MHGGFGGSRWEADWEYAGMVPAVGAGVAAALDGERGWHWSGLRRRVLMWARVLERGAQPDPFDVQIKPCCVHSI